MRGKRRARGCFSPPAGPVLGVGGGCGGETRGREPTLDKVKGLALSVEEGGGSGHSPAQQHTATQK